MATGFQAFHIEQLEKDQAGRKPYLEFLRRQGMSVGLYILPVEGTDQQHPHSSDEVYVVMAGKGTLRIDGHDEPVGVGSVVSVDHGVEHRFVDVAEDLHILVVFAPPESPDD